MKATKTNGREKKISAPQKRRGPKHDNVLFYEEESELEEALSYFEADLSHFSMNASGKGIGHEGYGPH